VERSGGAAPKEPRVSFHSGSERPRPESHDQQPSNKDQEDKTKKKVGSEAKYPRIGFLGQNATGATGLFTVFEGDTLRNKETRFGFQFNRFYRSPGGIRVTQVPVSFNYGFQDFLEVFFTADVAQNVQVNSPADLSGPLLRSALLSRGDNAAASLTGGVNRGFFPLPGLPVSGALVGGVLPGLPVGTPSPMSDPTLPGVKNAFLSSGFFNDLPFLADGGNSFGGVTFGAKYRFTSLNSLESNDPAKKPNADPLATIFAASVIGYVSLPAHRAEGLTSGGAGSSLFDGSGAGATDFGLFLAGSIYTPGFTSDVPQDSAGGNQDRFVNTFNNHFNIGYVRRGDPKAGGLRLLDRKDSVVFAYGADTMINPYLQTIGELKYERFIGGGTPNAFNLNPVDVTVGARVYPLGFLSKDDNAQAEKEGKKPKSRSWFLTVGFAYRYTLNEGGGISDVVSNRHGFVFQFTLGRDRTNGRIGGRPKPEPEVCTAAQNPPVLKQLVLNKDTFRRNERAEAKVEAENDYVPIIYSWKLVNEVSGRNEDARETGDDPSISFGLSNLQKGTYRVEVSATFEYLGLQCPLNQIQPQVFRVVNATPAIEILPERIGPISATVPRDYALSVTTSDADGDSLSVIWQTPPEITLSGQDRDVNRTFNSGTLRAGQRYRVVARVSDGQDSAEAQSEITVNNPPVVRLQPADAGLDLQHVEMGSPLTVIAKGEDPENQPLNYKWTSSGLSADGRALPRINLGGNDSLERRDVDTRTLEPGTYTISVVASDSLDESDPAQLQFTVVDSLETRKPQIFFDTDRYALKRAERLKLDREAEWLLEDPNSVIEIRVEGNADLRGSASYNFRLGCRRACAARNYLVKRRGIASNRIRIVVSYGEQKARRDRRFYARDRRVDLIYRRGTDPVVPTTGAGCQCQNK
jgi:outer membrane protein OmpA-like peptidoglycan-associated protein